jgi:hypothetical protein
MVSRRRVSRPSGLRTSIRFIATDQHRICDLNFAARMRAAGVFMAPGPSAPARPGAEISAAESQCRTRTERVTPAARKWTRGIDATLFVVKSFQNHCGPKSSALHYTLPRINKSVD